MDTNLLKLNFRLLAHPQNIARYNQMMIRRLDGETLTKLGREYGYTSGERTRQIQRKMLKRYGLDPTNIRLDIRKWHISHVNFIRKVARIYGEYVEQLIASDEVWRIQKNKNIELYQDIETMMRAVSDMDE